MTFADTNPPLPEPTTICQDWWPDINLVDAREVIRISGVITEPRLVEAIQNAIWAVNGELSSWAESYKKTEPGQLQDSRIIGLYKRAIYCYAKAELVERYRDYDMTAAGGRVAEEKDGVADDMRRNLRWAISDILGQSRVTVEAM